MKPVTAVAAAAVALLALADPAAAKLRMTLTVGDATPVMGQRVTVTLRTERAEVPASPPVVVAVAPGRPLYRVIGTVTGASSRPHAKIPRDGFGVALVQVSPLRWRTVVQFTKPGRWLLVVPAWGPGYSIPPPAVRAITVAGR